KLNRQELVNADAFGRLRVSNPQTVFESNSAEKKDTVLFSELTEGTASSVHHADGYTQMQVTSAGDRVVRQSFRYIYHQAGKTKTAFISGVLSAGGSLGVRSRMGLFDDVRDISVGSGGWGHFIEHDSDGELYLVERSSTGGTQADGRVPRASWNEAGEHSDLPSDLVTSAITLVIEDNWMGGAGMTRIGVVHHGEIKYLHYFVHENASAPYLKNGKLPVRYELESVDSTDEMRQFGCNVTSEGGFSPEGNLQTFSSFYQDRRAFRVLAQGGSSSDSEGNSKVRPIFNMRLSSQYPRATVVLRKLEVSILNNDPASWMLIQNGTIRNDAGSTDLDWGPVGTDSVVE
ncbi:unnamed protein product, partial [Chrysoparadoxa australica]